MSEDTRAPAQVLGDLTDDGGRTPDAELVLAVRAGDAAAFDTLYERHRDAALAVARQYTPSREAAEDVVAEAFARVLATLRRGGGPDVWVRAYVLTAVRRLAQDAAGARARETASEHVGELADDQLFAEPYVDPVVAACESSLAARAYRQLPERWQSVLWHVDVEGSRPAAVAGELGLTPNGVSALARRAREGLRVAYLREYVGSEAPPECQMYAGLLVPYVRGSMRDAERAIVDGHLEECGRCRAVVAELRDVNSTMRTLVGPLVLGAAAVQILLVMKGAAAAGVASPALASNGAGAASGGGSASTVGGLSPRALWVGAGTTAAVVTAVAVAVALLAPPAEPDDGVVAAPTADASAPAADPADPDAAGDPGPAGDPGAAGAADPAGEADGSVDPGAGPSPADLPALGPEDEPGDGAAGEPAAPGPAEPVNPDPDPGTDPDPDPGTDPGPVDPTPTPVVVTPDEYGALVAGGRGLVGVSLDVAAPDGATALSGGGTGVVVTFHLPPGLRATGAAASASDGPVARCDAGTGAVSCAVDLDGAGQVVLPLAVAPDLALGPISVPVDVTGPAGTEHVEVAATVAEGGLAARFTAQGAFAVTEVGAPLLRCADAALDCDAQRNNVVEMAPLDELGVGAASSTSVLPGLPGDVVQARLYWNGQLEPGATASGVARLRTPDGELVTVTADDTSLTQRSGTLPGASHYSSSADVTTLVAAHGSGEWALTTADVAVVDDNPYAGWALVVVHRSPGAQARVTLYDGLDDVPYGGAPRRVTLSGVAGTPTRVGVVAWEGDRGMADTVRLDGVPLQPYRWAPGAGAVPGLAGDAMDSTATGSRYASSLGVDAKAFAPVVLARRTVTLEADGSGDGYDLVAFTVTSDLPG